MVAVNLPASLHDYHLKSGSPAIDTGGTPVIPVPWDIDSQTRPAGARVRHGSRRVSIASGNLVATTTTSALRATVRITPARIAANRFIPGSRAARSISRTCADCTATMTIKHGHSVRTVHLRNRRGQFSTVVRHLSAGTYKVQVTVKSRSMGTIYRSAWRTVHVKPTSKHGKGNR